MRRREFMTLLGSTAAMTLHKPLVALAQQDDRVRALQDRILRMQAEGAAGKIAEFINGIESQIGWTTQLPLSVGTIDQRRFDGLRVLRQAPAVAELVQLDGAGIEQLRLSRLAMDVIASMRDFSNAPMFTEALANKVYYGPVYFRELGTAERRVAMPFLTLSLAGARRDAGVSVAEVNLSWLQDLMHATRIGEHGVAYVVDAAGRVLAHPDSTLVQRDFSGLAQVQAARSGVGSDTVQAAGDINGHEVVATSTAVAKPRLGWMVLVELPAGEIDASAR